jgi:hypothetical protein
MGITTYFVVRSTQDRQSLELRSQELGAGAMSFPKSGPVPGQFVDSTAKQLCIAVETHPPSLLGE